METRKSARMFVLGFIAGGVVFGAPVLAEQNEKKTVKPETMTCEEFLALGEEVRPQAVYWIEGYSESGAKVETMKIEAFARPITAVVAECEKTPKETLWQKIKKYF
jgi:acid stress chaperone HdeA